MATLSPKQRAARLLAMVATGLFGVGLGVGMFTFVYAKGASYMTNDPRACANCHVMQSYYDAWSRGSHHAVATCNDCHTPHDSLAAKYMVKARNGWNHSLKFTTGRFHEPIQITPANHDVTEHACRYCHADIVRQIDAAGGDEPISCVRCHENVGHMH